MASAHLQAASVPMRKTHDHNMSKDCTDIEELRHACVTTDHVESGFGAVDYFNFHTSSSMRASIGVAHSNRLHLFQSPGEKLAKARKVIMTERRIGGKGTKEDAEALVSKWEFTSFRSLPREERWELLTDLQRRSKELRGVYRAKMKEHDSARLKRKRDSRDNEITAASNKYLKYEQYNKITAITSTAGLDALTAKYKGKGKDNEYSEHLRDQLRVRQHCYNIKKTDLPKLSSGHGAEELARLESCLRPVVVKELPQKSASPLAQYLQPAHPAMTEEAMKQQVEHLQQVSKATFDIMRVAKSGVFRMKRPERSGKQKKSTAPRKPRAKKERRITDNEAAYVGQAFEEDAIEWMVLDVLWNKEDEEVVVHYYDIADAAREKLSEEEMRNAIERDKYYDCMERSSVSEIKQWVKDGAIEVEGAPAFKEDEENYGEDDI
jgi:hypothetical protein